MGRPRRRRISAKTGSLNAGQLALAYLRYIIAGEIGGARKEVGGLGAMPADLAHVLELSVVQDTETGCLFGFAQIAKRAHLARGRGGLQPIRDELSE